MEFSMEFWNFPWKLPRPQMEAKKSGRFNFYRNVTVFTMFLLKLALTEIGEIESGFKGYFFFDLDLLLAEFFIFYCHFKHDLNFD